MYDRTPGVAAVRAFAPQIPVARETRLPDPEMHERDMSREGSVRLWPGLALAEDNRANPRCIWFN